MALDSTLPTWSEAFREFILHLRASKALKTVRFYDVQLRQLINWCDEEHVSFGHFGKRHLDRYLVFRQEQGKSRTTLRHDAVAVKSFYRWCAKNDLIPRSPLAEYEVHNAPKPARYMPDDEQMAQLLQAVINYWNPNQNPDVRYIPQPRRAFHRDRNYAVILMLLDTACRIGEVMNLKLEDWRPKERQLTIRESKGKEPRTLPVSAELVQAVDVWLRVREKIAAGLPSGEDEGWLFLSEYGGRMVEGQFLKATKSVLRWAGVSDAVTLHSLRRYSLNRLAKHNLLGAQTIAGHKDAKTTLIYTKLDADFMRDVHNSVGVVRGILTNKRAKVRKRLA